MDSHQDVVDWMVVELAARNRLRQDEVVRHIKDRFGESYVYVNQNGNIAINRRVLQMFRDRTAGQVVWDRSLRGWRFRLDVDPPGRKAN